MHRCINVEKTGLPHCLKWKAWRCALHTRCSCCQCGRPVINAEPPGEMGPTSSCFCLSNLITMTGAGLRIGRFSPHDRLPLPLLLKRCIWIVFEIHLLGTSVSFIDSSSAVSLPCSQRESGFGHFVWINWCIWLNNSLTEELKLDWTGLTSQSWLVNSKSW